MPYKTHITIWSALSHTRPAQYDELLKVTVDCESPDEALAITKKLISETQHADNGYFNMPDYPNQNTRKRFTH